MFRRAAPGEIRKTPGREAGAMGPAGSNVPEPVVPPIIWTNSVAASVVPRSPIANDTPCQPKPQRHGKMKISVFRGRQVQLGHGSLITQNTEDEPVRRGVGGGH